MSSRKIHTYLENREKKLFTTRRMGNKYRDTKGEKEVELGNRGMRKKENKIKSSKT